MCLLGGTKSYVGVWFGFWSGLHLSEIVNLEFGVQTPIKFNVDSGYHEPITH